MNYTIYIIIGVAILLLGVQYWLNSHGTVDDKPAKKKYIYSRKTNMMSEAEMRFFKRLETVAGDRYYIFPQVHLDAILDHQAKGQNWKGALSAIQRKSVDYVLADRATLETVYAVELDDWSHDRDDRKQRDTGVEGLLQTAGIKLARFRNVDNMSDDEIAAAFQQLADTSRS